MTTNQPWQARIGNQRDWVWRGWQTRYSYLRARQKTYAASTPIIFVHGFGASIEHWRQNLPVIGEYHTVYAIDLLGFGASRKADTDYGAALWTEQLHDFWQTFIGVPVILVGNSIGSLVCLNATATYPEMVRGLVMLNIVDASVRESTLSPVRSLATTFENLLAFPWLIKRILKTARTPNFIRRGVKRAYINQQAITDELIEILSNPAYDEGSEQTFLRLFRSVRKVGFAKPIPELLPKVNVPILLLWGLEDKIISPKQARPIAKLNPLLKLVELENAGHCPHDEYPEQFNSLLLDWLGSI